jgi:SAM-dependent methyltransferase
MRADGYDAVAEDYVAQFVNELEHKPFDQELLTRFAAVAGATGPICDLGCGPGQVAKFLFERGAWAFGIDGSAGMAKAAGQAHRQLSFVQADMRVLPLANASLGGIAALYSLIHVPQEELTRTLLEWRRVMKPNGVVLISFHVGTEIIHRDEWWGKEVDLDFQFFQTSELVSRLRGAGFHVEGTWERPPYEPYEFPSTRGYILGSVNCEL